ncbi:MAG: anti-sigma factor ChrR (cupin superfamily) [Planctomycetota bacterium]|jgi:anti-sigma factor ChrR (cupin superfamily)
MRIQGLRLDGGGEGLPWRETRVEGISWLPLWLASEAAQGGEASGATVLIRMEPGRGYRPHRHVGGEDVLILAGGYGDEFGEYRAGEHVHYQPGSIHSPVALGDADRPIGPDNPACILFSCVPKGIETL